MGWPLGSRYIVEERLGAGGMGEVFRGLDRNGQEFAVKILRAELAGDPDLVARFVRERSVLVRVSSPHLIRLHDLVIEGPTLAIVMELVRGPDLRRVLRAAGPLSPAEVARLGSGIASALDAVHAAGIIHRDVKPENVLLDSTHNPPRVRVSDFGIARIIGAGSRTTTGVLMGTPHYIAPELTAWADPSPASDLYALGIVLYELSCGVTPFAADELAAVLRGHAHLVPGRPPGIPDAMWGLVAQLLAKDPAQRPHSAAQVARTLDELASGLDGLAAAMPLTAPPRATGPLRAPAVPADVPLAETVVVTRPDLPPGTEDRRTGRRTAVGLAGAAVVATLVWGWTQFTGGPAAAAELPRSADPLPVGFLVLESAPQSDDAHRLWTVDVNTGQSRQLTTGAASDPVLSPDRRTIAYLRPEADNVYGAWVMSADGLQQRRMLTTPGDRSCDTARLAWHGGADRNDSGDDRLALLCRSAGTSDYELRLTRVDGSPLTTLDRASSISEPTFSPDGRSIVYAKSTAAGRDALFTVPTAGDGQPRQLTFPTEAAGDADAAISPDGSLLAFRRDFGSLDRRLFLYDFSTGKTTQVLQDGPANQADPSWSPDSNRLAFKAGGQHDPAGDLWLVNRDGTGLTKVAVASGPGTSPSWTSR